MRSEARDLAAAGVASTHPAVTGPEPAPRERSLPCAAPRPDTTSLARALWGLLASWLALGVLRTALDGSLGAEGALAAGSVAALVPAVWAVRAPALRRAGSELEPCALGVALGFLLLPLMLLPVGEVGLALELGEDPRPPGLAAGAAVSLAAVLVAPVSEELLFRRLLLPALADRVGAAPALLAVTALFAACHAGSWPALVAAAAGAVFGLVMLASRSVALCIGLHAGLNLSALAGGVPPLGDPLIAAPPPFAPALLAALLAIGRGGEALRAARARRAARAG